MRTRAQRRHKRASVINRKAKIERSIYGKELFIRGTLAKGKIHCSCWMCSSKTRVHSMKHADLKAFGRDLHKLREVECE